MQKSCRQAWKPKFNSRDPTLKEEKINSHKLSFSFHTCAGARTRTCTGFILSIIWGHYYSLTVPCTVRSHKGASWKWNKCHKLPTLRHWVWASNWKTRASGLWCYPNWKTRHWREAQNGDVGKHRCCCRLKWIWLLTSLKFELRVRNSWPSRSVGSTLIYFTKYRLKINQAHCWEYTEWVQAIFLSFSKV